jgi:hypothetical protein
LERTRRLAVIRPDEWVPLMGENARRVYRLDNTETNVASVGMP